MHTFLTRIARITRIKDLFSISGEIGNGIIRYAEVLILGIDRFLESYPYTVGISKRYLMPVTDKLRILISIFIR